MKTGSLLTGLAVSLALTATAQEKKGIIAEGGSPDDRASARVLYWDQKADASAGWFSIDYGRPVWKKDYEDPAKRSPVMQGFGVLNGVLRLVGQTRPLLFMGVPGLLSLMLGVFMGLAVVSIYITSEKLAVGYALIGVLCMVMGTMSLFSGIILLSVRALLLSVLRPAAVAEPE